MVSVLTCLGGVPTDCLCFNNSAGMYGAIFYVVAGSARVCMAFHGKKSLLNYIALNYRKCMD